jgi:hypothetical protein
MHLVKWLPKPFKSICFQSHNLSHHDPETLPEREYEGRFSGKSPLKMEGVSG